VSGAFRRSVEYQEHRAEPNHPIQEDGEDPRNGRHHLPHIHHASGCGFPFVNQVERLSSSPSARNESPAGGSPFASFVAGPLGSYGETLDMMNASIARMGLVFVTLASLGGCSACGPKFPKDKPPQIASVYITPKQPTVTADWPVSFKAVALSTDGVRFDPLHYDDEGYTVLWEATKLSGASLTGGSSGPDGVKVAMDARRTRTRCR
jgi:hypothetical protein